MNFCPDCPHTGGRCMDSCRYLHFTPAHEPTGDTHHTEIPLTGQDRAVADRLAHSMGTLQDDFHDADSLWQWWYRERTSVDEWARVARALRIHGLMIVNREGKEPR